MSFVSAKRLLSEKSNATEEGSFVSAHQIKRQREVEREEHKVEQVEESRRFNVKGLKYREEPLPAWVEAGMECCLELDEGNPHHGNAVKLWVQQGGQERRFWLGFLPRAMADAMVADKTIKISNARTSVVQRDAVEIVADFVFPRGVVPVDSLTAVEVARPLPPRPPAVVFSSHLGLHVLSLFDGIGGAFVSLQLAQVPVATYLSSEVDDDANLVLRHRYGERIQHVGDVTALDEQWLSSIANHIDLLVGGSPCQDLSMARLLMCGSRDGLGGDKSKLFFEYVRVLRTLQSLRSPSRPPLFFVLENVGSMDYPNLQRINQELGLTPVRLQSRLISPCERDRLFWSNLPLCNLPLDQGPLPRLLSGQLVSSWNDTGKAFTIVSSESLNWVLETDGITTRPLYPEEEEEMMGFPVGYTDVDSGTLSHASRHRLIGNSFQCNTVAVLLAPLRKPLDQIKVRSGKSLSQWCSTCMSANCWSIHS